MNFKLLAILTVSLVCTKDAYAMQQHQSQQRHAREATLNTRLGLIEPDPNDYANLFNIITPHLGVQQHNIEAVDIGGQGEGSDYGAALLSIFRKTTYRIDENKKLHLNFYKPIVKLSELKNHFSLIWETPKKPKTPTKPTWRSKLSSTFSSKPALLGYGFVSALGLAALNTKYNFTSYFPSFLKK